MTTDTAKQENEVFDIDAFLEEFGSSGGGSQGEVIPMMLRVGIGVFAGSKSKFYPVGKYQRGDKVPVRKIAQMYADKLVKDKKIEYTPKVEPCIQQVWYAELLGRETDKQPKWTDGKWEEMKYRAVYFVDGEEQETGEWLVFSKQWIGDDPPILKADFGKKLWVHQTWARHPEFDEKLWVNEDGSVNLEPADTFARKTIEMKDGEPALDDNGKVRATYYRVVSHVIGEDREEAERWYEENQGGESSGETTKSVEDELKKLAEGSDLDLEIYEELFNSVHDGSASSADDDIVSSYEEIGIGKDVIEKLEELAKVYQPL